MRVVRWGTALAVRLPSCVIKALQLKEGDHIEIQVAAVRTLEVERARSPRELLAPLRKYRGKLPADFKFERTV